MCGKLKRKQTVQTEKRPVDTVTFRHEYKYMIDSIQESILRIKADVILEPDPNAADDGTYLIRSLYFDDVDDTCLMANCAGTDRRAKFRIRFYNEDIRNIHLEKKSKLRGMCHKDSCMLTPQECIQMQNGVIPDVTDEMPEIKKKLLLEMKLAGMQPKVIVTYQRIAYVYPAGNVRVTIDRNITSSPDVEDFLDRKYRERPVLPLGRSLLEVKWDEVLPRHIKQNLQMDCLTWTAFSKYYLCRKYHL